MLRSSARSDANALIFKYYFFNFFVVIAINSDEWMTRMRQVLDDCKAKAA